MSTREERQAERKRRLNRGDVGERREAVQRHDADGQGFGHRLIVQGRRCAPLAQVARRVSLR